MKKSTFTLVEIMVVVALIGLLVTIAVPSFVSARNTGRKNACINNLRLIDSAKQQWALFTDAGDDAVPVWTDLVYNSATGTGDLLMRPTCRAGGTYTLGAVSALPACTFPGHAY